MPVTPAALAELRALLGEDGVLASDAALFTYEADSLALEKFRPDVVALPRSTDEVCAVVRWARAHGLGVVPRGAGTGLSGGATCERGGVSLALTRMHRILRLDEERMFAWVHPGLVNLSLSQELAASGLYFAPDPSSQQVSTIGGNISTNAGGPHCLKYGVTYNHVLGLTVVTADGTAVTLGSEGCDSPGFDLASVVVGSEGTCAIVTEACVRLSPAPEAVKTMLFDFADIVDAGRTVSRVIAAGIVPAALEIMDRVTTGVVEAWLRMGLPTDAGALLLIELDGPAVALEAQVPRIEAIAKEHGARSIRVAKDADERAQLWKGRKSAFGAFGRAATGFYVMDGTVPRTRVAEALAATYRLAGEHGLTVGNVFHAGDGNLHPNIMFDAHSPEQQAAALAVAQAILRECIRLGGTISGEHGIGMEKRPMMTELYAPEDLEVMARVRGAFDPAGRLNPGKVLPAREGDRTARGEAGAPAQLGGLKPGAGAEGPWV